jgi:hypothetical protein
MQLRKLNRMSDKRNRLKPRLLAAPQAGAAGKSSPGRSRDSASAHFYTIEEIHIRAETVTPLLREILDFEPAPHWGINE